MKKLTRSFLGLLLAFGLGLALGSEARASVVARAPKHVYTLAYTTVISSVTPFTVLQATSTLQDQPGAVYEIVLGTGAAADYLVLYDTIPFNTSTLIGNATVATAQAYQLGPRLYYSSTSANTTIVFDPPLEFYHGLLAIQSAAGNIAAIVYEVGRGLSGQ